MIKRTTHWLCHDSKRVLAKPYLPGEEISHGANTRTGLLMARVLAIPQADAALILEQTLERFRSRHHGFEELLERDRKSTRLNSSHSELSRMPSSA